MKSYVMVSLSLETVRDADIIKLIEDLKQKRQATAYMKQAIREKMAREAKGGLDVRNC